MTCSGLDNKFCQCEFGTGSSLTHCTLFFSVQKNAKQSKTCTNHQHLINVIILSWKEGGEEGGNTTSGGWFTKEIEFYLTLEG